VAQETAGDGGDDVDVAGMVSVRPSINCLCRMSESAFAPEPPFPPRTGLGLTVIVVVIAGVNGTTVFARTYPAVGPPEPRTSMRGSQFWTR
jgi:hypothetical protein